MKNKNGLLAASLSFAVACGTASAASPAAAAEQKPAAEASSQQRFTASQLNELISESTGAHATNIRVVGAGPLVTVLADKKAEDTDRDLKIDAIFLTKALCDAAPGQIDKVKTIFSQPNHDPRYVVISKKQIQDYGSGRIAPDVLLKSMFFESVGQQGAPDVVQGPEYDRRLLIRQRIDKLRKQGTGVRPFEDIFSQIETAAKAGSPDVTQKVANLEGKLKDQEDVLRAARRSASGHGIQGNQGSGVAQAAGTGPSSGGGEYIPPEATMIKASYLSKSDECIRQVQSVSSSDANTLRDLKTRIDRAFASNRQGEAFGLIHSFAILVQQKIGIDILGPGLQQGPGQMQQQQRSHAWGQNDQQNQTPGGRQGGGRMGGPGGGPMGGPGGGPMGGPGGGPMGGPGGGPMGGPGGGAQNW